MCIISFTHTHTQGGIRLNILAENGTIVRALLGLTTWHLTEDSTSVTHTHTHTHTHRFTENHAREKKISFSTIFSRAFTQEVTLPADFTCDSCSLQLVRQAGEWTAPGGYLFWSCADITVVDIAGVQKLT